MLRTTRAEFGYAIPQYHRGGRTKSGSSSTTYPSFRLPGFLRPHAAAPWLDKGTTDQLKKDRHMNFADPLAMTLKTFLGRGANMAKYKFFRVSGNSRTSPNVKKYVDRFLRDKKLVEYEAPWLVRASNRELRQMSGIRSAARSSFVAETAGSHDHMIGTLDSLDVSALRICSLLASRWPRVRSTVLGEGCLKWWIDFSTLEESRVLENILAFRGNEIDNEEIEQTLFSPANAATISKQIGTSMVKPRTYSAFLQAYTTSGMRDLWLEQSLLKGFSDQLVQIVANNNNSNGSYSPNLKASGAAAVDADKLFSSLVQILFVGLVRHQSFADFTSLGFSEWSRCCVPLDDNNNNNKGMKQTKKDAMQKLPNLTTIAMRKKMSNNNNNNSNKGKNLLVDEAIALAYVTSVFCSCRNSFPSSSSSSSTSAIGLSSIPSSQVCTVDINGNQLPESILNDPSCLYFSTLFYSWNFRSEMCHGIQTATSCAWLLEMSSLTLSSLITTCTGQGEEEKKRTERVLQAVLLVAKCLDRWCFLMQKSSSSRKTNCSSICVLVTLSRMKEEILDKLVLTSAFDEKRLAGTSQHSVASAGGSNSQKEDERGDEFKESDEKAHQESENKQIEFVCSTSQNKNIPLKPTSYLPVDVEIIRNGNNSKSERKEGKSSNRNIDHQEQEQDATQLFGTAVHDAIQISVDSLSSLFSLENAQQANEQENDQQQENDQEQEEEVSVRRDVLAELADSCDALSACAFLDSKQKARLLKVRDAAQASVEV